MYQQNKLEQEILNRQAELEQRNLNQQIIYSNSRIQNDKHMKYDHQCSELSDKELDPEDFKVQESSSLNDEHNTIYETISISNSMQSYAMIADFEIRNASYSIPHDMDDTYESRNSISRMNSILEESDILEYQSRNPNPYTDYVFDNHNSYDI